MKAKAFNRIWGEPFDYAYLLRIEQRKLKEMAKYFKKSHIVVGWERILKELQLAVNLLDIAMENDQYFKSWLNQNYKSVIKDGLDSSVKFPVYVNVRNANRFLPKINLMEGNSRLYEVMKSELRCQKAFHLYQKLRLYRMQTWWD